MCVEGEYVYVWTAGQARHNKKANSSIWLERVMRLNRVVVEFPLPCLFDSSTVTALPRLSLSATCCNIQTDLPLQHVLPWDAPTLRLATSDQQLTCVG